MKLTVNFLDELFRLLFLKKPLLTICVKHFKYEFIPKEYPEYKLILKSILTQFELTGKLPSIGVVSQQYESKPDVQDALNKIKDSVIQDQEVMITQLQDYIRNVEFQILNENVVTLYQKGEHSEAIDLNAKESKRISEISLRNDAGEFIRIFKDFGKENSERKAEQSEEKNPKVPFYIDPLDEITYGGLDVTDIALWIMRSGIGKSTALKWTGLKAAMAGHKVLHFQLEGSKKEARDKYTQIFTALPYHSIKSGDIPRESMVKIEKTIAQMEQAQRDVFIYSFEKFGEPTMVDIRELTLEYEKITGSFPDLIVIDSLDLLSTGLYKKIDNDPAYKKEKMQGVAQLMKNLAVEFKTRILTATQTGDVSTNIWNDPDKVIDRSNTEGDRTLVKPFAYVFTGNQTRDEQKGKTLRIFVDKLRNYNPKSQIYPICTEFDKGAFYSTKRTIEKFYNKNNDGL